MRVQVPQHVQTLLNIFNQFQMKQNCANKAANVHFNVRCVDFEVMDIERHCFEDKSDDHHFNSENPQTCVEIATLLLWTNLVLLCDLMGIRDKRNCVKIFFQLDNFLTINNLEDGVVSMMMMVFMFMLMHIMVALLRSKRPQILAVVL